MVAGDPYRRGAYTPTAGLETIEWEGGEPSGQATVQELLAFMRALAAGFLGPPE